MYKQRREIIREIFNSQPFTSFKELEARFPELSSMTIRRDVDYFQNKGEVVKVRGGARSVKFMMTSMDATFDKRRSDNIMSKRKIACVASKFVLSGKKIFFDAGTTVMALASSLSDKRYNITTNCPHVAFELLKHQDVVINIIGGTLNRTDLSISGTQSNKYIDSCDFDIAFIAPTGFSEFNGFTTGNWSECDVKRRAVKKSEKVIVLLDSSKFNKSMPYTFANLEDISMIICDVRPPERIVELANQYGVEIIIADEVSI
jgi:DeoR/GlpR family transcriptional regulator of sugar metabolism